MTDTVAPKPATPAKPAAARRNPTATPAPPTPSAPDPSPEPALEPAPDPAAEPTPDLGEHPSGTPAAQPLAEQAETAPQNAGQGAGALLRILVAEDEALIRLDLAEMLAECGYQVVAQVANGEQAVEQARELRPDLVVMDVKMPVMDGITAAELIGTERIAPVVMLTAFSQRELVERARDAGVMAYVVKPFTAADLTPAIDIARSRWVELHTLESEIADLGERLATRKAVDRAKGVLMRQLKIGEAEAFRWIQKTAMDRRLVMREVAEAVITGLPG